MRREFSRLAVTRWPTLRRLLVVFVFVGCAAPAPPASTLMPTSSPTAGVGSVIPTASAPGPPTTPVPSASALVINVTLTDALRIEPARMEVPAGRPVTFVVTNEGALPHEFYVGDAAAQSAHEAEMEASGGTMVHDDEFGIGVSAGATKELTVTFPAAGEWLAGCHVTNHYSGGMKATITVTD